MNVWIGMPPQPKVPPAMVIVDAIYEAALVPERWVDVLDEIGRPSGSRGGTLITLQADGGVGAINTRIYDPMIREWSDDIETRQSNVRPARSLARLHAGWLTDLDIMTKAEIDRDPHYTKYYRRVGIGWTAGTVLPMPNGDILVFDLGRPTELGPYDPEAIAGLDALRPHLARAAMLSARLGLERVRAVAETLAILGLPGAVLGSGGRVLSANALFDAIGASFKLGFRDRIGLSDPSADQLLKQALADLGGGRTTGVNSIPIAARDDRPAQIVHLLPIRRDARDLFSQAVALLVVTPVTAPAVPTRSLLVALFDLTPSEARVARGLAGGETIADLARRLGVASETVRSQLKQIFAKTGTHRQAELARLLAGAAPFAEGGSPERGD